MKKIALNLFILLCISSLSAQEIEFKNFEWQKEPKLHQLDAKENLLPELTIYKEMVNEFAFEGDNFFNFYFFHKIVRVNADDAIEANNTIYVPAGGSTIAVLEMKARVINSKGEVIELDEDDIKEAVDEESKSSYRYFALEGVDIGSEVEYYYLLKKEATMTGSKFTLQTDIKTKKLKFAIISPMHLDFVFKSYNGLAAVQKDSVIEDKSRWFLEVENMPGLKQETMSAYKSGLQSIIYKLYSNSYSGKKNLYSYSTVAQNYYENVHPELSKKDQKGIKALLKTSKIAEAETEEEKIRVLEQYIKTNFASQTYGNANLGNLEFILSNKIASRLGLMRLYAACFKQLDFKYNLVLTTNRYDNKFDKDFESYSFLDDQLFYMTEIDKYLSPIAIFSRLGYLPSPYTNNYGLFIKPIVLGDYESALGKIKFIEALPHQLNSDTFEVNVSFDEDITTPKISYTKSQHGLEVLSIQPLYDFIDGEVEEELDEATAKFINQYVDVEDVKIENKGGANFGVKPLLTSATLKGTEVFVEKAGTKYLFKIGDLIGPQMEMYQEDGEERQLDIEMTYNHSYYRTIVFNIPEGYQIKNLDDLNFDVSFTYEDYKSAFFVSSYTVEGNTVTLKNEEVYDAMFYPKEYFTEYQKVINAAADFNKVTLILEKR